MLREIKSFFGSAVGYLVIAVFLLLNGLFLWVFDGDYNILQSGFADLTPFFTISPWIFLFLIPAVTMRSFADEKKQGTLELLLTKPLTTWQIVSGKFLGAFLLIAIAIIPTIVYIFVLRQLGMQEGNLDMGSTIGSYFGLLFLASGYIAIGIFTSSLTENQIVSFIASLLLCFLVYFGFSALQQSGGDLANWVAPLGMSGHFESMGRGVIDTRDVVYFISVSVLFLSFTVFRLDALKSAS
ncbi:MAG: gliding motility-associated ABC transporter permease subunit GldF [Chitinophagaceae bacterium]|nr:MAG: gliding motility-associated ABC transporter permease subunit GldF [Chitinophagaceae bacterium]